MNLVLKRSGGHNIVFRAMALPRGTPAATTKAARIMVGRRNADQPYSETKLIGVFEPGAANEFDFDPDVDRNVMLGTISLSADDTPSVVNWSTALWATVFYQRETDAPVIGQNSPATLDAVEIGITNFTRFARLRRITISEAADMSNPVAVLLFDSADYVARELPRYFTLQREAGGIVTEDGTALTSEGGDWLITETGAGTLPRTVYITVAHSSGTAWTPESNVLEVTFAAGDGTGGSDGDFDPTPRDFRNLNVM